jgi:Holliday junction resolvase RusA-like endonuclease
MREFNFVFYLKPETKNRIAIVNGRHVKIKKARDYEKEIRNQSSYMCKKQKLFKPLKNSLEAEINIRLQRPKSVKRKYPCVRPDLDNYIKPILDGMNKVVYVDDGQICRININKKYADRNYIVVKIKEME